MKLHCFQHAELEGPGAIAAWASVRGHDLNVALLPRGDALPELSDVDALIVLGGGMNVYETDRYPWLTSEKRFLEAALKKGIPALGICLGAQLLGDVLGAKVRRNDHPEIGWWPITKTEPGLRSPFLSGFMPEADVFQWHGDTFDLPSGSVHLARSGACENQAFAYGEKVVGVQFHPEITRFIAADLIKTCPEDLAPGRYVQTAKAILADETRFHTMHAPLRALLDGLMPDDAPSR